MKTKSLLVIVAGLLISFHAFTITEKTPVGIDFFSKVKSISHLSEHNGNIFFIITQPNLEKNSYDKGLYQLVNGQPELLVKNIGNYQIVDDDIIFRDNREEDKQQKQPDELTIFYRLGTGYGEAQEWVRLPYRVSQVEWIDKDRFFFLTSYNHNQTEKGRKPGDDYRIFDELPFWSNGRGDVSGLRSHLYFYNKGHITLLSDTLESVSSISISPDKKNIAFTKRPSFYGKSPEGNTLVTLDIETLSSKEWPLFLRANYSSILFEAPDRILLTIQRSLERDKIENAGLYRLDLSSGHVTSLYNGDPYGFSSSINTDIGGGARSKIISGKKGITYLSTVVDYAPLVRLPEKGQPTILTPRNATIQEYIPYKDGYLVTALVDRAGSEIYEVNGKGELTPLTTINKPVFDQHAISNPVEIRFTNSKGLELNGYVLSPVEQEPGKKYPCILNIHGGPKTAYGTVFFHEMQYWANQGYAVIFTNPTGSDGRGSDFSDIRAKVGTIDYQDLMDFVDAAIEQIDFIDKDRLGVTGGSYGGIMTNWIIGQTNRFKAAASQRSISSWLTFSTTSDIGHTFTYNYFGTDLWKNTDLLWERSPLKYADKATTPTLFIHSEQDYRCWVVEGVQMYYALQYFDIPSRLVLFKNETHELSRSGKPSNRIKRLDEITSWFDKYLK